MIKIHDFAMQKGVTPNAIYKHIRNYKEQLQGHISKQGKSGTFLDEYAQEYISKLMIVNPVVISGSGIRDLNEKYLKVVEELNQANKRIIELLDIKTDQAILLESQKHKEQLLIEQIEKYDQENKTLKAELEQEKNKGFFARLFGK